MSLKKERLEILRNRYRLYLEAERAILQGQSYSLEGLSLTRANLDTVRKTLAAIEVEILKCERAVSGSSRSRLRIVVPSDGLNMMRCRRLCRT